MKKIMWLFLAMAVLLAGCSKSEGNKSDKDGSGTRGESISTEEKTESKMTGPVQVVSREDGSGTRGAFIEIFDMVEKVDGKKIDMTTPTAEISNSTSVVITSVATDKSSIGYISLGSLSEDVKALEIDGVKATVENIKNGSYKVQRPFHIATLGEESDLVKDFIGYIHSPEGQKIVEDTGYVSKEAKGEFTGDVSGKIVIAGSSSVSPVMEKLIEHYQEINPKARIELQQSDSTTGIHSLVEGIADIGMASRELKDSELEKGVKPYVIGIDGIAVIVNNENPTKGASAESIKEIFIGNLTDWADVK